MIKFLSEPNYYIRVEAFERVLGQGVLIRNRFGRSSSIIDLLLFNSALVKVHALLTLCTPFTFFIRLDEGGNEGGQILYNADVGNVENGGVGVSGYGHDKAGAMHPNRVLDSAGDAAGYVEPGRHRGPGKPHLPFVFQPSTVAYGPGTGHGRPSEQSGQTLDEAQVFFLAGAPPC